MPATRALRAIQPSWLGRSILVGLVALALGGCSSLFGDGDTVQDHYKAPTTSSAGFSLFGGSSENNATVATGTPSAGTGLGVGVNSYLWRASLDTISFMPLASADPFGGVIITDWYSPSASPTERFKVTVFILDRQLRADALRVSVFRQQKNADGQWADAALDAETPSKLENAILTRARQLRIASADD